MFKYVNTLLDRILPLGIPGMDCEICIQGKTVFRRTEGFADRERQLLMTGNERYNLYSLSKPITCSALLLLWEEGKFQMEDPVSKYLPEFASMTVREPDGTVRPVKNPMTIRHLFTMTAGLNYSLRSPGLLACYDATHGSCPTREAVRYLAKEPLDFEPGTRWQYSLCHDVLAAVAEEIVGKTFNDFVTERIFAPLGMRSATYLLPAAESGTIAAQYTVLPGSSAVVRIGSGNFNGDTTASYRLGSDYASGGAGCVSTLADYRTFANALLAGKILKPETLRKMITPALSDAQLQSYWYADYGYGLGVRCAASAALPDFGWGGAAGAYLVIDPVHQATLVYFQHVLNSPSRQLRAQLGVMLQRDLAEA